VSLCQQPLDKSACRLGLPSKKCYIDRLADVVDVDWRTPPSSMPQSSKRTAKPRTRTFTGCLTCRARKVKCDLARPTCKNCERLGHSCQGYQAQLQWLPKWEPDQVDGHLSEKPAFTSPEIRRTRTELFDSRLTATHGRRS